MSSRTKVLLVLLGMALIDTVIPIPIAVLLLIYVMYQKPVWFKELVEELYIL